MMLLPVRLTSHAILALGSLGALFGQETDLKDEDPAIPNIRLTEKNWGQGSLKTLWPFSNPLQGNCFLTRAKRNGPTYLGQSLMDRWSSFVAESWENTSSTSTHVTVSGVNTPFNSHTKSVTLSVGSGKGTEATFWFEETICEVASLFALEKMAMEWNQSAPHPNWKPYAVEFKKYAEQRISKHRLPESHTCPMVRGTGLHAQSQRMTEAATPEWPPLCFRSFRNTQ